MKYERDPYYRLFVESPQSEFLIMPGRGGAHSAFKVFTEFRDPRTKKFIAFLEAGSGDWSYDRKSIYINTTHPRQSFTIVLEPLTVPFPEINAL